jgi:hypothetical protein
MSRVVRDGMAPPSARVSLTRGPVCINSIGRGGNSLRGVGQRGAGPLGSGEVKSVPLGSGKVERVVPGVARAGTHSLGVGRGEFPIGGGRLRLFRDP